MSRSIGNCIADSLELCLGYTERLLKDVPAETFARFANVGDVAVNSNHPAFILGHLSIYPTKIVEQLGHDPAEVAVPDNYQDLFSPAATCQDDVGGAIYPPMEEITKLYFNGYRVALDKLRAASDEIFQNENPGEGRIKELFPTLGGMHGFYVSGHIMMHLGQLSAWRRMQGMEPA